MIDQVLAEIGLKTNLTLVILTFALLCGRIVPVIIFSPFLGGEVVPSEIKLGLGVTLGIVLFPAVSERVTEIPTHAIPFIFILSKEVFIGLSMAFVVAMVFEAAQIAGTVIDTLSGANMAQVYAPQLGTQVTIFSSLKLQLAVALFLTLNGHHVVIKAFADSLVALPLDRMPTFSHGAWPFFDLVMRVFGDLLIVGLALAGPAYLATFLADLALGMINKVAPQIQVYFISMSIKPMVSALMVLLVIHLIVGRITLEFGHMLETLKRALQLLT